MNRLFDSTNQYYRFHARIYDYTRWAFLFGRKKLVQQALEYHDPKKILEIGCGTGSLIRTLNNMCFDTDIVGLDQSEDMLYQARSIQPAYGNNISFVQQDLHEYLHSSAEHFDLVLCSYSLSMLDEMKYPSLQAIQGLLTKNGLLAVVDFHDSPFGWFKSWMAMNHVDFDPDLYLTLGQYYSPVSAEIRNAYLGWWEYLLFLGHPNTN